MEARRAAPAKAAGAPRPKPNGAHQNASPEADRREPNELKARAQAASASLTATIERAAAKAGVTVEAFAKLPVGEQNAFLIETKADAEHPENVAATRWVSPATIERSPFNRDMFDPEKLAELIENVKQHGVLQPLLVRPVRYEMRETPLGWHLMCNEAVVAEFTASQEGLVRKRLSDYTHITLQIVAGERRWRAATVAKLSAIPVVVRQLTDEEAIEFQAIENLQREDLNAIHEAEKYQQLLDSYHKRGLEPAAAMDLLVEKIGKAKSTIYERLRLLKLPEKAKAAAIAGTLPPSHAALITKLADDPEAQAAVTARILKPARHEVASHEHDSGDPAAGLPVMSFRDAKHLIDQAARQIETRRTFNKLRDEFVKKGNLVLSSADNKKVFPHTYSSSPDAKSGFVRVEDYCPLGSNSKSWKEALGKFAPSPVLGQTQSGEAVILYAATEARAAAKKKGLKARTTDSGGRVESAADKKRKEELAARQERFDATLQLIGERAKNVSGDSPALWRFLFEQIVRSGAARGDGMRKRLGIKGDYWDHKPLLEHFKNATAKELRAAIAELLVGGHRPGLYGQPKWDSAFVSACAAFEVKVPSWNVGGAKQTSGR
jgi:ParB family chromosome partitioning protein